MTQVFSGLVEIKDGYRISDDGENGQIWIGGKDLLTELLFNSGTKVICGIMNDKFDGDLFIDYGWGYSEYTPIDSDELKIGNTNILDILETHEGKHITFIISDEPIDLLDPTIFLTVPKN